MTRSFSRLAHAAVLAALVPGTLAAADTDIRIQEPWARASIGTERPAAAYLTLVNDGEATVTVSGVETPIADRADLHRTVRKGEIMHMEPAGAVDVAPGETVTMMPGGLHIMLMDLASPLNKGERFTLTLHLADGRTLTTDVPVLGPGARGPAQ